MTDEYRLWMNDQGTMLVRVWGDLDADGRWLLNGQMEVMSRDHPDAIWRPPVLVSQQERP